MSYFSLRMYFSFSFLFLRKAWCQCKSIVYNGVRLKADIFTLITNFVYIYLSVVKKPLQPGAPKWKIPPPSPIRTRRVRTRLFECLSLIGSKRDNISGCEKKITEMYGSPPPSPQVLVYKSVVSNYTFPPLYFKQMVAKT